MKNGRTGLLISLAIAASWGAAPVLGAVSRPHIPQEVSRVLNHRYPGWALTEVSDETLERCGWRRGTSGFEPSLVWGDFNNDGTRDYAVRFDFKNERYVLALLRAGDSYREFVLSRGEPGWDVLDIAKAGGSYYDHEKNVEATYPAESPVEISCESSAVVFIYRNGRFEKVWVSD